MGCNLCGADRPVPLRRIRAMAGDQDWHDLVKCGTCDLVYLHPLPSPDLILDLSPEYQDDIRTVREELERSWVGRLGVRMLRRQRTPSGNTPGRLLDVGCSYGYYLAFLRGLGWQVEGIELDVEAAARARRAYGLDVHAGAAEEVLPRLPAAAYDVVTLWNVLEHVADPKGVLTQVARVLAPGGRVMIEVPNAACLWASAFGSYWFTYEVPFHQYHFTAKTLGALLERTGFEVGRVGWEPGAAELVWSVELAWARIRTGRWHGQLHWRPISSALAFPVEKLLSRFGRSTHLDAVGVKRGATA